MTTKSVSVEEFLEEYFKRNGMEPESDMDLYHFSRAWVELRNATGNDPVDPELFTAISAAAAKIADANGPNTDSANLFFDAVAVLALAMQKTEWV